MMRRHVEVNRVFLATILIFTIAGVWMAGREGWDPMALQTIAQILLAAPYAVYLLATRQNVVESVGLKRVRVGSVALLVLFAYAIYPFLGCISTLSLLVSKNVIGARVLEMTQGKPFLLSLVILALLPCLFEEFVYRGVLYGEYKKACVMKGVLLSSLLFALMHRNLNQFAYTFVMGLILSLLVEATGSLLAPAIVHFTINGSSVVTTYVVARLSKTLGQYGLTQDALTGALDASNETLLIALRTFAVLSIPSLAFGALLFVAIAKREGRYERFFEASFWKLRSQGEGIVTPSLLCGMAICVFFIATSWLAN